MTAPTKYTMGHDPTNDVLWAIKPPFEVKTDDGRILEVLAWTPRVAVGELITVVLEARIAVPKEEQDD